MLGRSSSHTEPEIIICINGLSNESGKVDASACVLKVAAFPVVLLLLEQHGLGA